MRRPSVNCLARTYDQYNTHASYIMGKCMEQPRGILATHGSEALPRVFTGKTSQPRQEIYLSCCPTHPKTDVRRLVEPWLNYEVLGLLSSL